MSVTRGSDITDYVGNKIYENGSLKRILVDGGYWESGEYHFYIQDHQGNNRVVARGLGNGTVVQTNHYYPFGMTFGEVAASEQDKQAYKYNGKELDRKNGLNLYDYSARYMEPALGRFTTMDPHAENYYAWSPYHYAGNSPVKITDPTGMDWYVNDEGQYFWKEGSQDIDGYKNVGSYVSIQTGKNAYINFYQNAGIRANKAVNAFDLISQSGKLQNELLGKNSVLSEESQSALFNGLVSQSVDAVARPIGETITEYGAGAIGGAALGKAVSWGVGKVASKVSASTGIKASNGVLVTGFTRHGLNKAIGSSGRLGGKPEAIIVALQNPLKTSKVLQNDGGFYQQFVGKSARVIVNPRTEKIISVNPTSSKRARKLLKQ